MKNKINIRNNYGEMIINHKGKDIIVFISISDIDFIQKRKWCINNNYVSSFSPPHHVKLHRYLLNLKKDEQCDHINGNPLDNRRENLRICTLQENMLNRKIPKNNKSGVKGVYWDKTNKKWRAQIWVYKKIIEVGSFKNLEDAIKARKLAEEKYFKEFNRKNP